MSHSNPSFPAIVTMSNSFVAAAYFMGRFLVRRKLVSLGIVCMCLGWGVVALIIMGLVPKEAFMIFAWLGMSISTAMLIAVFAQEFWADYHREVDANKRREDEDRKLRGEE